MLLVSKRKVFKTRAFLFFLIILNTYIIISFFMAIYIWNQFNFVNIKIIEPIGRLTDNIDSIEVTTFQLNINNDYKSKTSFNTFDYHINNIGSRNSFEVSKEDRNIIVMLGDSFIFGYGLNDNETISYFLNRLDKKRKYINLGVPNFNICDSVERYLAKSQFINEPAIVIIGIIANDVYDSRFISKRIGKAVDNNYKYILFPLRIVINKNKLLVHYTKIIENKIYKDTSYMRYFEYIQKPLSRLMGIISKNRSKLIIFCYSLPEDYYRLQLKQYCQKNNIYFFMVNKLLGTEYYVRERLPDGHPNANFNRILASEIKNKIEEIEKTGTTLE